MSRVTSLLLLLFGIAATSVLAFTWSMFFAPYATHVMLSPTINVDIYNLPLVKHGFTTQDGLELVGYSAQQPEAKGWIILVHGYTPNGWKSMLSLGQFLHQQGYNVFIPSLRSFGESEGSQIALGTQEWQDVQAADLLVGEELNVQKVPVGWYGVSMGATSAIVAAGRGTQPDFLIAQVPFASVDRYFTRQLRDTQLPFWLFSPATQVVSKLEFGLNDHKNTALAQIRKVTVPFLVIGGEHDNQVLFEDSSLLYSLAGTAVEHKMYASLDGGHDLYAEQPHAIEEILKGFLKSVETMNLPVSDPAL